MRLTQPFSLLLLSSLHYVPTIAIGLGSSAQKYQMMADMGLLPDGTPMQVASEPATRKLFRQTTNSTNTTEHIVPEYVTLPLDHFGDGSAGTFNNRFWVSEISYTGGPVFLYDVGEANAQREALFRLLNETSFVKQFVDQFGGIGIVWEHRYYGNSTPVPITLDTPSAAFRYLTTEQALADIADFAANFSRPDIDADLTPSGTPWVFLGASYPGMRAAFMREFYPDTILASYASSAPVQASIDMSFYFEPVWQGMNAYGWGNCTADIHAAINYMDKEMEHPRKAAALKEQFLGRGAANNSNAGFADALSTIFYLWQAYGVDGGPHGLRFFCNFISTDPETNTTSPAEGWAASPGANYTAHRWSRWPFFAQTVNDDLQTSCEGPLIVQNGTAVPTCDLDQRSADAAAISWTWQYCTQWGFLQAANVGPHQLVSRYNSLQHQRDICHRQFPDGRASGLLPEWPRADETNARFGGWGVRPSNTYWSGGQFDPWRTLSPLSDMPFAPRDVAVTQEVPACGVGTGEEEVFGYVMPGAEHGFDFRTTFPPGATSRGFFLEGLREWLKCWRPEGIEDGVRMW